MNWLIAYVAFGWVIRLTMLPVVLRRDFAPGAAMAWLGIIALHPYIGSTLYLLLGEALLGPRRSAQHQRQVQHLRSLSWNDAAKPAEELPAPPYHGMVLQAQKIGGLPVLNGNSVEPLGDTPGFIDRLIADINAARSRVNLLYFIFATDSTGQRVTGAIVDAARRGVKCQVLLDAVASRQFFRSDLARQLRATGVDLAAALPVAPLTRGLTRMDLRNHRKLAVIDGRIAFAGSHNIIDADYGGRRGAPWIDLTGRYTGPIVGEFLALFNEDWTFETGQDQPPPEPVAPAGNVAMQVVPTGPGNSNDTYRRVLLAAVQCAREELFITTPYFVPDEPTLVSLMMAADRGVNVTLLLPLTPDHPITAAAGRAHFSRMLDSGIQIYLYRPGLMHSKTITVDDAFAILGSANLDVRSFNLNFELSGLLYGPDITKQLRDIQQAYLKDSRQLTAEEWAKRSRILGYGERALSLLSPIL